MVRPTNFDWVKRETIDLFATEWSQTQSTDSTGTAGSSGSPIRVRDGPPKDGSIRDQRFIDNREFARPIELDTLEGGVPPWERANSSSQEIKDILSSRKGGRGRQKSLKGLELNLQSSTSKMRKRRQTIDSTIRETENERPASLIDLEGGMAPWEEKRRPTPLVDLEGGVAPWEREKASRPSALIDLEKGAAPWESPLGSVRHTQLTGRNYSAGDDCRKQQARKRLAEVVDKIMEKESKDVERHDIDSCVKRWRRRAANNIREEGANDRKPIDLEHQVLVDMQIDRTMTEIPESLAYDIDLEVYPILKEMYKFYKKNLGEKDPATVQVCERLEQLEVELTFEGAGTAYHHVFSRK